MTWQKINDMPVSACIASHNAYRWARGLERKEGRNPCLGQLNGALTYNLSKISLHTFMHYSCYTKEGKKGGGGLTVISFIFVSLALALN